jgi:glycerophosphoryl diester phosphodiesterase
MQNYLPDLSMTRADSVTCTERFRRSPRHTVAMLVLAHRGASRDAPENTPEAFRLADRQGADGVELDVRLHPTGRLFVRHDPFPLADGAAPSPSSSTPASLDDVLDACGDRMLVNVEIKNLASDGGFDPTMSIAQRTIDVLRRRGARWSDRWLISSFSWATIDACRRLSPDIPTALLCVKVDTATLERVVAGGHAAIHPWARALDADAVDRCHRAGLRLNTWTCNDPARLVELASFGVDAVCTDVPAIALAALSPSAGEQA